MASAAGTVTGVKGEIRWHHYPAADVYQYVVTYHKENKTWSIRATCPYHDRFKLAQTPLTFVALRKTLEGEPREWRWPVQTHSITNGTLVGTLGPVEKRTRKPATTETNSHAVSICSTQDYAALTGGRRAAYLARTHR